MSKTVLLLIDIQHDFMPGGALAVPDGDQIVPVVAELVKQHDRVIATQDYHPQWHKSFASTHGKPPFTEIDLPYGRQMLWPDHCVQGTYGSYFALPIDLMSRIEDVVLKGQNPEIDSYSAFRENDRVTSTGLAEDLRAAGVERIVLCGLALDYCVLYSALDAAEEGFEVVVELDACRGITAEGCAEAIAKMRAAGITLKGQALAPELVGGEP